MTTGQIISNRFKKDIVIPLAFVSDKIIHFLTTQSVILQCILRIKPHFENWCVVWGNSFNSNLHKIEKLQRRACKLILGTDYISLEDAWRQFYVVIWRISFERWMADLATHKQKKIQALSWKFADARILPSCMELNGTDLLCTEPWWKGYGLINWNRGV